MRSRNIKPGFFKNEYLAECDPLARILFEALWCMSDREGRLELRPKRIKAEALPYDNCDILRLMNQLIDRKFITAYKYGDNFFLEIPTFREHQTPHIKEPESMIPASDKTDTCMILAHLIPDSLNLIPDSPFPHRKGVKVVNKDLFEKFWTAYPKKKSKGDAENAFKKINPSEQLVETMISKIEQAKTSEDWTKQGGQYIPYPATWLNRKGWEDEYEKPRIVDTDFAYIEEAFKGVS